MPNSLSTAAIRRSACIAIASPPPRQNPRMRAMIGLGNAAYFARPTPASRSYSCCALASERLFSNWLMSAPETNALCPAPVRITTRTDPSSVNSSRISPNPVHISSDIALRFSGWLNVISPTPSSFAASILPPAYSRVTPPLGKSFISDRSIPAHLGDLVGGIPHRCQHLIGARSHLRRRQADVLGEAGDADRRGHHLRVTDHRRVHLGRHAEMLHLRIGEYLVDRVNRPARHAGAFQQLD